MVQQSEFIQPVFGSLRHKIGGFIKNVREQKGLSQDDLSSLMDVSRSTISKIENGKFAISVDYLEKFSFYLDFDIILVKKVIEGDVIRK